MNTVVRALLLSLPLLLAGPAAQAGGRVSMPTVSTDPAQGPCLAPAAEMRRTHMDLLKHQRDRTLRLGERGAKVSLNGCISCHAGKTSRTVIGSRTEFCESCHAYAGVKLDCFECHQAKAGQTVASATPGSRP